MWWTCPLSGCGRWPRMPIRLFPRWSPSSSRAPRDCRAMAVPEPFALSPLDLVETLSFWHSMAHEVLLNVLWIVWNLYCRLLFFYQNRSSERRPGRFNEHFVTNPIVSKSIVSDEDERWTVLSPIIPAFYLGAQNVGIWLISRPDVMDVSDIV